MLVPGVGEYPRGGGEKVSGCMPLLLSLRKQMAASLFEDNGGCVEADAGLSQLVSSGPVIQYVNTMIVFIKVDYSSHSFEERIESCYDKKRLKLYIS